MHTRATVLGVANGRARLGCVAHATCDACSGGRGCALRIFGAQRDSSIEVPASDADGRELETGQAVVVDIDDAALVSGTARACLPMLAGLFTGVGLMRFGSTAESLAIAAGLAGMASGWFVSRRWLRRMPPTVRIWPGGGDGGS